MFLPVCVCVGQENLGKKTGRAKLPSLARNPSDPLHTLGGRIQLSPELVRSESWQKLFANIRSSSHALSR
jgi:hypothetical protein